MRSEGLFKTAALAKVAKEYFTWNCITVKLHIKYQKAKDLLCRNMFPISAKWINIIAADV